MSDRSQQQAVECTLPEEQLDDRMDAEFVTLQQRFLNAREQADGYSLVFDRRTETLAALAAFVTAELECCSFAEYAIVTSPPYEHVEFVITGPDGTKDQFEELIERLAEGDSGEYIDSGNVDQRAAIRERYGVIGDLADEEESRSGDGPCCGDPDEATERALQVGYSRDDLESVDADANLGLGSGNPTAIAELAPGEVVLDLGSGAGFDCFLAAQAVEPGGHVIGVDMTPEMIETAREHRESQDLTNVEFRLGEIEYLPVADDSIDVVMSNCVINLSPKPARVFKEAFRVLKPGGRLAISDIVETRTGPRDSTSVTEFEGECTEQPLSIQEIESIAREAGFENVEIEPDENSRTVIQEWETSREISDEVISASIEGRKPRSSENPS